MLKWLVLYCIENCICIYGLTEVNMLYKSTLKNPLYFASTSLFFKFCGSLIMTCFMGLIPKGLSIQVSWTRWASEEIYNFSKAIYLELFCHANIKNMHRFKSVLRVSCAKNCTHMHHKTCIIYITCFRVSKNLGGSMFFQWVAIYRLVKSITNSWPIFCSPTRSCVQM